MENDQVAIPAWLLTLKEERQGSAGAHLSALGCARKEGERGRQEEKNCCVEILRSHSGALTEREEWPMELGHLPFPYCQEQTRKRLCQQGTNKLHIKQRKGHLPGEGKLGREKPDFVYS